MNANDQNQPVEIAPGTPPGLPAPANSEHRLWVAQTRPNEVASLGPTFDAFLRLSEVEIPDAGWARARRILRMVLRAQGVSDPEDAVGWVRYLGRGPFYVTFVAEVSGADNAPGRQWVVRLPEPDADPDFSTRTAREARLLQFLATQSPRYRIPEVHAVVPERDQLVLVLSFVHGRPLDLRSKRESRVASWDIVAEVAAAIHGTGERPGGASDPWPLRSILSGFETRRAFAIAELDKLAEIDHPATRQALAWARDHLPPEAPTCLIHGALDSQNIIVEASHNPPDRPVDPAQPVEPRRSIVGWQHARLGDPAYDLATVTRGERKPFQLNGGLRRLLSAYRAHDGAAVSANHVQIYELCVVGQAWRAAIDRHLPRAQLDRHRFRFIDTLHRIRSPR